MRPKATAARSPAKSPTAPALAPAPSGPPPTVESLGQQLRDVLPTRRLHSISVCDHEANVLWLSEGALGPDEHVVILEALEQLAGDAALPCHETALEDGRLAVFLPVRAPTGRLVGVAMILADSKSVGDDTIERMTAAPVRTIMHRLAVLMKPAAGAEGAVPEVEIESLEIELTEVVSVQASPPPPPQPAPVAAAPRDFSPLELAARHAPQKPQAPVVTPRRDLSPLELASRNAAPEPKPPAGLEPADLAILDLVPLELAPEPEPEAQAPEPAPEEDPPSHEPISAEAVNDILEFELTPEQPREGTRPAPAPAARPEPAKPATRGAARAPSRAPAKAAPAAAEPDEDSGVGMVHLEFLPEPPVVNAAPAAPAARRPTLVPEPAPAAPPVPRPARVLAPPEPRAARPPASAAAATANIARPAAFVPSVARVPTSPRPAPAPAPAPVAVAAPAPAPAEAPAAAPSPGEAGLPLEVLPFVKLRAGGQMRRFQVQPRGNAPQRDPATLDALVLQRLLGWLATHRTAWNSQPTGFTLNLSVATLEDERFAQKIAAALNANGLAAETLGFEIAEPLCAQRRAQVERFIGQCEQLGSWIAIDDFSFDSSVLPLLRSKATRLVKINPRLTSSALRDKLSQGIVVATVQAAKVLGIHCSAKKVDSQASLQWLTAIGCDFAQGAAVARALPLEGLAALDAPKGAPSPAA